MSSEGNANSNNVKAKEIKTGPKAVGQARPEARCLEDTRQLAGANGEVREEAQATRRMAETIVTE